MLQSYFPPYQAVTVHISCVSWEILSLTVNSSKPIIPRQLSTSGGFFFTLLGIETACDAHNSIALYRT